jgi:uncharacterized lipoprotein YmbA
MKSRVEKYIRIEDFGASPTGKTRIWRVWNHLHQVGEDQVVRRLP